MTETNPAKRKSFSLNKSNYVFLFAYILIAFILFFSLREFNAYGLGRTMGRMLGAMFFGIIIGYVFWLFSFKNNRIGAWGFNLAIAYLLFVLTTSYYKQYQIQESTLSIQKAESHFDAVVKQEDSSMDDVNAAYDQLKESMYDGIANQAKHATGKNKQVIIIQENYLKEIEVVITKWQNNLSRFYEKDVLDPSMLKIDPVVYQNRLQLIQNMLTSTLDYKDVMVNMEATVTERLQPLNLSEKQLDQIVKKFMYSPNYSLAQLVLMFDGLIDYLEQCIVVLDILNNNQDGWLLEGNDVIIEADQLFNIYNSAIEDLWQKEAKVQELYADVFL